MRDIAAGFLSIFLLSLSAHGQAVLLPPRTVALDSLAEFRPTPGNWSIAGGVGGDPRLEVGTLVGLPGTGVLVSRPTIEAHENLYTTWEHGDIDVELEFLMPRGSNSGVFLQGRYEVQLYDGWDEKDLRLISGRIWSSAPQPGIDEATRFKGSSPLANANRAPGLWQHMFIRFRAPRFDASGRKTENARFEQVMLNGFLVQENVEVPSPTSPAAARLGEASLGPLMFQGDHGVVAIRNLKVKRFGVGRLRVEKLGYELYAGSTSDGSPEARGAIERFESPPLNGYDTGVMVFSGVLVLPVTGRYGFWTPKDWYAACQGSHATRLTIDDRVVFQCHDGATEQLVGSLQLSAGRHALRFSCDAQDLSEPVQAFLFAEGPDIPVQLLAAPSYDTHSREQWRVPSEPIPIEPQDRILVQRGFMPHESGVRPYAISVGTPGGMHYAYDPETAELLQLWRGKFLDAGGMWFLRGQYRGIQTYPPGFIDMKSDLWFLRAGETWHTGQQVYPAGPRLKLRSGPLLVQLRKNVRSPNGRDGSAAFRGYRTDANGQPVFRYEFAGFSMTDRIVSESEGRALTRTLHFTGTIPEGSWAVIAQDAAISSRPGGYIIGDRRYYIDWPANARLQPHIREDGPHKQLAVRLPAGAAASDIAYTLVW